MKSIESRSRVGISAAAILVIVAMPLCSSAAASTRPVYGGTLRVELHTATLNLDPRQWKQGAPESGEEERIAELLYDRLVALDNFGRFQPRLASEWVHDAAFKRWQFTIRGGVKFSDGADLTGQEVAAALKPLLPHALEVTGAANFIIIQSQSPAPDLLELLASGRYFIYHAASDGALAGTGAFMIAPASASSAQDNSRLPNTAKVHLLRLQANPDCWAGRPYVNSIEIRLGIPSLRAMFDVQLGKADIALLTPDVARRATQSDLRVWNSVPVTLYALQFLSPQTRRANDALRQALSLSLDRATMAGVLLQKQAEPAAALLPQWLSGYAFLFDMETNQDLAQKLQKTLPAASVGAAVPLRLRIDAPGEMTRLIGERVVVNARQAGLSMQLAAQSDNPVEEREVSTGKNIAGETFVRLFAWRYTLLSPRAEMDAMVNALHLENAAADTPAGDSGQLYEAERALLDEKEILPLVILPDYVGLSPAVRDWLPTNWGEWNLADVWLDRGEQTSPIPSDAAVKSRSGAQP